jgi:dolichol-phosphate mannosyltransferase
MAEACSIVIPAYDESEAIGKVIEEIFAEVKNCEVIVVDDGSKDNTSEVAQKRGVLVIRHPTNQGMKAAILTGISHAKNDIIVKVDGDYTYPASEIPKLVNQIESGYDLVIGNRFAGGGQNMSRMNQLGNRLLSYAVSLVTGQYVADSQSGMRAYRKRVVEGMKFESRNLEFDAEVTAKACIAGFRLIEIPINYRPRIGKSKLSPTQDGYRIARTIVVAVRQVASPAVKFFFLYPSLVSGALFVLFGAATLVYYLQGTLAQHIFFPVLTSFFGIGALLLLGVGLVLNIFFVSIRRIETQLRKLNE